jgi:hypothetical protein
MTTNGAPNDFELKYGGADLKQIDVRTITNPDECHWLMEYLDSIVAKIEEQIEFSMIRDPDTGTYPRDSGWRARANRALRGARILRQAVQNRLGVLNKDVRQAKGLRFENTFIQAAQKLLTVDTFEEIKAETWKILDSTPQRKD